MRLSIRDCLAFEQHLIDATRTVVGWRAPWLSRFDRFWQQRRGRSLLAPPKVWYERPIYYKGNPHSVVGPEAGDAATTPVSPSGWITSWNSRP
ncbi:MAG: hypothetical protein R3C99_02385 [Pirellulaceae bacterium]